MPPTRTDSITNIATRKRKKSDDEASLSSLSSSGDDSNEGGGETKVAQHDVSPRIRKKSSSRNKRPSRKRERLEGPSEKVLEEIVVVEREVPRLTPKKRTLSEVQESSSNYQIEARKKANKKDQTDSKRSKVSPPSSDMSKKQSESKGTLLTGQADNPLTSEPTPSPNNEDEGASDAVHYHPHDPNHHNAEDEEEEQDVEEQEQNLLVVPYSVSSSADEMDDDPSNHDAPVHKALMTPQQLQPHNETHGDEEVPKESPTAAVVPNHPVNNNNNSNYRLPAHVTTEKHKPNHAQEDNDDPGVASSGDADQDDDGKEEVIVPRSLLRTLEQEIASTTNVNHPAADAGIEDEQQLQQATEVTRSNKASITSHRQDEDGEVLSVRSQDSQVLPTLKAFIATGQELVQSQVLASSSSAFSYVGRNDDEETPKRSPSRAPVKATKFIQAPAPIMAASKASKRKPRTTRVVSPSGMVETSWANRQQTTGTSPIRHHTSKKKQRSLLLVLFLALFKMIAIAEVFAIATLVVPRWLPCEDEQHHHDGAITMRNNKETTRTDNLFSPWWRNMQVRREDHLSDSNLIHKVLCGGIGNNTEWAIASMKEIRQDLSFALDPWLQDGKEIASTSIHKIQDYCSTKIPVLLEDGREMIVTVANKIRYEYSETALTLLDDGREMLWMTGNKIRRHALVALDNGGTMMVNFFDYCSTTIPILLEDGREMIVTVLDNGGTMLVNFFHKIEEYVATILTNGGNTSFNYQLHQFVETMPKDEVHTPSSALKSQVMSRTSTARVWLRDGKEVTLTSIHKIQDYCSRTIPRLLEDGRETLVAVANKIHEDYSETALTLLEDIRDMLWMTGNKIRGYAWIVLDNGGTMLVNFFDYCSTTIPRLLEDGREMVVTVAYKIHEDYSETALTLLEDSRDMLWMTGNKIRRYAWIALDNGGTMMVNCFHKIQEYVEELHLFVETIRKEEVLHTPSDTIKSQVTSRVSTTRLVHDERREEVQSVELNVPVTIEQIDVPPAQLVEEFITQEPEKTPEEVTATDETHIRGDHEILYDDLENSQVHYKVGKIPVSDSEAQEPEETPEDVTATVQGHMSGDHEILYDDLENSQVHYEVDRQQPLGQPVEQVLPVSDSEALVTEEMNGEVPPLTNGIREQEYEEAINGPDTGDSISEDTQGFDSESTEEWKESHAELEAEDPPESVDRVSQEQIEAMEQSESDSAPLDENHLEESENPAEPIDESFDSSESTEEWKESHVELEAEDPPENIDPVSQEQIEVVEQPYSDSAPLLDENHLEENESQAEAIDEPSQEAYDSSSLEEGQREESESQAEENDQIAKEIESQTKEAIDESPEEEGHDDISVMDESQCKENESEKAEEAMDHPKPDNGAPSQKPVEADFEQNDQAMEHHAGEAAVPQQPSSLPGSPEKESSSMTPALLLVNSTLTQNNDLISAEDTVLGKKKRKRGLLRRFSSFLSKSKAAKKKKTKNSNTTLPSSSLLQKLKSPVKAVANTLKKSLPFPFEHSSQRVRTPLQLREPVGAPILQKQRVSKKKNKSSSSSSSSGEVKKVRPRAIGKWLKNRLLDTKAVLSQATIEEFV